VTTEESGAGRRRGPVVAAFACALVTLAVDQASKQWALDDLGDGRTVRVLGRFLTFTLHFNPGAAFSFGTGATWVFTAVSCAVVLALPFVIARSRSAPWAIALGVVWGGAAGNFADRLVREPGVGRGHVVDFIGYSDWFVGNVADIALVGGILALLAISFFDGGDGSGERGGDARSAGGGETRNGSQSDGDLGRIPAGGTGAQAGGDGGGG